MEIYHVGQVLKVRHIGFVCETRTKPSSESVFPARGETFNTKIYFGEAIYFLFIFIFTLLSYFMISILYFYPQPEP